MGRKEHVSETPATACLREHGVPFSEHVYDYVEYGGRRGYLVGIDPIVLVDLLKAQPVDCAALP